MGDSSECMVMMPSNGLSGGGLTIFASTCATTLEMVGGREEGEKRCVGQLRMRGLPCTTTHLVCPNAHSTQPSSGPNVISGVRISSGCRPSRRSPSCTVRNTNSFSGIDGEGGLMLSFLGAYSTYDRRNFGCRDERRRDPTRLMNESVQEANKEQGIPKAEICPRQRGCQTRHALCSRGVTV